MVLLHIINCLIQLTVLFTNPKLWAGNSVGNGGDVVICPNQIEILDFYEGRELHKKAFITSSVNDYNEIINERLEKLRKISPNLGDLYEKKVKNYKIEFKENIKLKNLKDENHVFIAKNCFLKQIAHKLNQTPVIHDIVINKEHWDKLDAQNRAGLIMHEVIYDHFRFFKIYESSRVRKFVSTIFSKEFETMTTQDLKSLFLDLKVPFDG